MDSQDRNHGKRSRHWIRVRRVLTLALATAAVGLACVPLPDAPDPPPITEDGTPGPDAPNIVFVLLDDLDETATPYWDAMPATKALVADTGRSFTESFSPTPICCPARASILTGQYGHNTGVLTNGGEQGGWETFTEGGGEDRAVSVHLQQRGYRTMFVGKYLNGYEEVPTHVPPGWSEWYGAADNLAYAGYGYRLNENGTLVQYGTQPEDYITDVIAEKTVDFIERSEADDDRPFFTMVTPTAPHFPLAPAPRHAGNEWTDAQPPRTPNFYEADLSDKPWWLQASGDSRDQTRDWNTWDHRNRMGSLLAVDEMVADIVDALERTGELDRTVIVLASDNGYNLGSHRLVHKMAPYEESIRVPLVISGPGVEPGTDDHMVIQPDWAPTLLDIAGVQPPSYMDGVSLAPLLDGAHQGPWRDDFIAQYAGGAALNGIGAELPPEFNFALGVLLVAQEIPSYQALRTGDHLYVEWFGDEWGGWQATELYDLDSDPYQLDNLLATPEGRADNAQLVTTMHLRLEELSECAGAECSQAT